MWGRLRGAEDLAMASPEACTIQMSTPAQYGRGVHTAQDMRICIFGKGQQAKGGQRMSRTAPARPVHGLAAPCSCNSSTTPSLDAHKPCCT